MDEPAATYRRQLLAQVLDIVPNHMAALMEPGESLPADWPVDGTTTDRGWQPPPPSSGVIYEGRMET